MGGDPGREVGGGSAGWVGKSGGSGGRRVGNIDGREGGRGRLEGKEGGRRQEGKQEKQEAKGGEQRGRIASRPRRGCGRGKQGRRDPASRNCIRRAVPGPAMLSSCRSKRVNWSLGPNQLPRGPGSG